MNRLDARRRFLGASALSALAAIVRPTVGHGVAATDDRSLRVRKLGWAGVLLENRNSALFIDAVAPNPKKNEPPDLLRTNLPASALVTHNHGDHFDNATLQRLLGQLGVLACWRSSADWLDGRGLRVQPVDLWQPVFFPRYGDDFVAFAVPAVDGWGVPQVSWVVDANGVRVFRGGDTQWHGHFADIGRAYGPFNAAFLPINGARQQVGRFRDQGIPAVLTPSQAVAANQLLRSDLLVPIHYGDPDPPKYVEVDDPLGEVTRVAAQQGVKVAALKVGEALSL